MSNLLILHKQLLALIISNHMTNPLMYHKKNIKYLCGHFNYVIHKWR